MDTGVVDAGPLTGDTYVFVADTVDVAGPDPGVRSSASISTVA